MKNKIPIAKIGKTHGLKGWVKLHLLTDFPEQFQKNRNFDSDKGELRIEQINPKNRVFVADHNGLLDSAIVRNLKEKGYYQNIITRTRQELDLLDEVAVSKFYKEENRKYK